MKAYPNPACTIAFLLLLPLLLFTTCKDDMVQTITYRTKVPVYMAVSAVRAQVISNQASKQLSVPGKIYVYGNYLFIGEVNKGIHVVDNSNPASPRLINFINIPGSADMAVNSNILYADQYTDLLAFDLTNPAYIKLINRVEDVFENQYFNKEKGLIISYKDSLITTVTSAKINNNREYLNDSANGAYNSIGGQSYGQGGSTARFTLMNSNLYTVDHASLKLFNVSKPMQPEFVNSINMGWGIETIFPYRDKLFIGSTNGMHIYDASNPASPVKLSTYQHVTSCDPVVVQGNYAYVTLRSGNFCQLGANILDVVDVGDAANPKLISSFPMLNPHGLAVSATNLYICEGENGFKAFDHSDVLTIGQKQLTFIKGIDAKDVIVGPKSLIVTGLKGIYQYDCSNASALKQLSHIGLSDSTLP